MNNIELHTMIRDAYDLDETAAYLGVTVQTLHNWRSAKRGPAWFRIGRHVRYRKADVDAWVQRKLTGTNEQVITSRQEAMSA
jgi:excisionase family DNA binding protein